MGFLFNYNFEIRLLEKGDGDSFFSTSGKEVLHVGSDLGLLKPNPLCICADPFLFVKDDELFLFFESQRRHTGKGELHMIKTSDLKHWSVEKCVLRENFHLSFPNVFEDGGECYMIPESGHNGDIRLYRATDGSLEKWELDKVLISDGRTWADSDIIRKNGKYYLLTCEYSKNGLTGRLFMSDSLKGKYEEHPSSPIGTDMSTGRNAGSVIKMDDQLFRPVQDCSLGYGKQISIMRIDTLSETEFSESLHIRHIIDRNDDFYKRGGHQFNAVEFKGRTIVATDAKKRNYNIPDYLYGCCNNICKRG